MNQYIVPANSKKGQLIGNVFRPIDLAIVICGAVISLAFMFAIPGDSLLVIFIKLLPIAICLLLVMPVAQYHNVLVFLQEAYLYLVGRKVYKWKGWCASYVEDDAKQK